MFRCAVHTGEILRDELAEFWLNLQTQFDLAIADQRVGGAVRELPRATSRR